MNQDLTKQYQEVMNDPDIHFETVREKIDGHRILLVPGFLSEALITAGKFGFGGYFDDQMEWFTRDSIEYIRVSIESEASTEKNGKKILSAIQRDRKPVYIISHSKGGLDTLDAVLSDPSVWNQIGGWVAIQTPFYGTPIADLILGQKILRLLIASPFLTLMGGSNASLLDMQVTKRRDLQKVNHDRIQKFLKAFPMLCFASHAGEIDTDLEPIRKVIHDQAGVNDGLVPLDSAILEGSDFVKTSGVDHAMPVMKASEKLDREDFTKTLLYLLLKS